MSGMEGLGRVFNVVPSADGVYINLRDCEAVTFVGFLTGAVGDTYTLQEATAQSGTGARNLLTISQYYTSTGVGTGQWARQSQTAAATVVATANAAQNAVAFTVRADELSDGFSYIKVTSTGAGAVTAIAHDLQVMRAPASLPALSA